MEPIDLASHVTATAKYATNPDGTSARRPVPLAERAAAMRESLAEARQDEATIENDWTTGRVAFSRTRGVLISELLLELSERLAPGTVVGPIRGDDAMADLVAELAWQLDSARTASQDGD